MDGKGTRCFCATARHVYTVPSSIGPAVEWPTPDEVAGFELQWPGGKLLLASGFAQLSYELLLRRLAQPIFKPRATFFLKVHACERPSHHRGSVHTNKPYAPPVVPSATSLLSAASWAGSCVPARTGAPTDPNACEGEPFFGSNTGNIGPSRAGGPIKRRETGATRGPRVCVNDDDAGAEGTDALATTP